MYCRNRRIGPLGPPPYRSIVTPPIIYTTWHVQPLFLFLYGCRSGNEREFPYRRWTPWLDRRLWREGRRGKVSWWSAGEKCDSKVAYSLRVMPPFSLCVGLAAWRQTELGWSHLSNVVRVCAPAAEPDGIGGMMAIFYPKASNLLLNSSNKAVRIYMRNK